MNKLTSPLEGSQQAGCQPRMVRLLETADSLICVLDNLTRGFVKHVPDDKDCWCNGCVHPRAVAWMDEFRALRSAMEPSDRHCLKCNSMLWRREIATCLNCDAPNEERIQSPGTGKQDHE